jgi:tetratricopeptide (TPR) repeat protein
MSLLLVSLAIAFAQPADAQQALGTGAGRELVPFEVLFMQANLARAKGDVVLADRMFGAAARSRYATPTAYVYWARMHRERGDLNRANTIVNLGLARFDADAALLLERGWLALSGEDWPTLRAALAELPESGSALPFAAYLRGRLAQQDGRLDDALAELRTAAGAAHPLQTESLEALAELQAARGDRKSAAQSLRQALELSRSHEQRARIEGRLSNLAQSGGSGWYGLRTMVGLHGDSNVNLAPQLFPDSELTGGRLSVGVFQRLSPGGKKADAGVRLTGFQTLHVGDAALADFNSTLLSAEAFGRLDVDRHRLGLTFGYDSVFLFFRPADEQHFSERIHGGPTWLFGLPGGRVYAGLLAERSLYYAGNTAGIDDRRSNSIDVRLDGGGEAKLADEHKLGLDVSVGRQDARGDNYDALTWSAQLRHAWERDVWGTHVGTGYEDRLYNNHRAGRRDHLATATAGAQWRYAGTASLGVVVSFEQNLAAGPDLYDYRRLIGGVVWQTRWLPPAAD